MIVNEKEVNIKAELLCYGIRQNHLLERAYECQNPYDLTRTGNVGLQTLIGESRVPANIPIFNNFNKLSPYELSLIDKQYFIKNHITGNSIKADILPCPDWYNVNVANNRFAGQYILQEGVSTLICSISESCGYVTKGIQCKFCAIGTQISKPCESIFDRKQHIFNSLTIALKGDGITSINLTGGNTLSNDNGASRYLEYVKHIRKYSDIPICLEISPPENLNYLQILKSAGVNSLMMNIEIWDESIRRIMMPGKSKIQREKYIKAWEYASNIFGYGKISSVLIIGLESKKSEMTAINNMIEIGTIPSIMPFRPNDGSNLENYQITNPNTVIELSQFAAAKIHEKGLKIDNNLGCLGCGACATEKDYLRIIEENRENE